MADPDAVIQSIFETLEKNKRCGKAADALRELYGAGEWQGEKIVAAIREGLDETEGD